PRGAAAAALGRNRPKPGRHAEPETFRRPPPDDDGAQHGAAAARVQVRGARPQARAGVAQPGPLPGGRRLGLQAHGRPQVRVAPSGDAGGDGPPVQLHELPLRGEEGQGRAAVRRELRQHPAAAGAGPEAGGRGGLVREGQVPGGRRRHGPGAVAEVPAGGAAAEGPGAEEGVGGVQAGARPRGDALRRAGGRPLPPLPQPAPDAPGGEVGGAAAGFAAARPPEPFAGGPFAGARLPVGEVRPGLGRAGPQRDGGGARRGRAGGGGGGGGGGGRGCGGGGGGRADVRRPDVQPPAEGAIPEGARPRAQHPARRPLAPRRRRPGRHGQPHGLRRLRARPRQLGRAPPGGGRVLGPLRRHRPRRQPARQPAVREPARPHRPPGVVLEELKPAPRRRRRRPRPRRSQPAD
ncbi:MAG: hypothetical protein BJ554DRAFT_3866, partial [Olpidium bornovanus]